jgi:hypothetical protein
LPNKLFNHAIAAGSKIFYLALRIVGAVIVMPKAVKPEEEKKKKVYYKKKEKKAAEVKKK